MTLTRPIKASKKKEERGRPYRQVLLRKTIAAGGCVSATGVTGAVELVTFIPSHLAVKWDAVKIKTDKGLWDDGWVVVEVWQEVDEIFLDAMRNALKHHAEVSDI